MSKSRIRTTEMTLEGLRKSAGLTQQDLGNAINVTDQTISNWEQYKSVPKLTVRQIVILLTKLPCTLLELAEIFDEIERRVKAEQST